MPSGKSSSVVTLLGIDLAWGEKNPDGVAVLRLSGRTLEVVDICRVHGDTFLLGLVERMTGTGRTFVAVDAPLVCPNVMGTRPVDRLTHTLFGKFHAACHPANLTKCPRPVRIAEALQGRGFEIGWDIGKRSVAEVYPHPAMVRAFGLDRIIKYKKGRVLEKRREFRRYQRCFRALLEKEWAGLKVKGWHLVDNLLRETWTKDAEDRTDALFCVWIAWNHIRHEGRRSEVIGNRETGFILLPKGAGPAGGTGPKTSARNRATG
jgi:predicted RNase H-like nuclease